MARSFILGALLCVALIPTGAQAAYRFSDFAAHAPIHTFGARSASPHGLTPSLVREAYRLPASSGRGTIAVIAAYDDPTIESDLAVFDAAFGLSACTVRSGCFEKHVMRAGTAHDAGWDMETSLDVEWAHAIAPEAKILLVEAATKSGTNLLAAVDYARSRSDVVAVSMSWGGPEFSDEVSLDGHFTSAHAAFFAASGDTGAGTSWPAVSPNVVSVGGTSLRLKPGAQPAETAWSGSGGGVSLYEPEPGFQKKYSISRAGGMRSVPDVSANADPAHGYSIYRGGWYVVGGTSAATPVWAAIRSLGLSADNARMYADKSAVLYGRYFRDIVSGKNGACGFFCTARGRYDYVTGLGSPLTVQF